jgi:cutinase
VIARHIARLLCAAVVTTSALLSAPLPFAAAQPCPDVEIVFARGTYEPPGVGGMGQAFVDSLRSQVGTKSVGVYPVSYPASTDFPTAVDGVRDAAVHVESMAANCPNTKMCSADSPKVRP